VWAQGILFVVEERLGEVLRGVKPADFPVVKPFATNGCRNFDTLSPVQ
jgi:hypothetical protein